MRVIPPATSTATDSTARISGGCARCSRDLAPPPRRVSSTASGSGPSAPPHRARRRRRHQERRDRRRLDRRQGDARPGHAPARRALPALRLLVATSATSRPATRLPCARTGPCRPAPASYARRVLRPEPRAGCGVNAGERRAFWHYRLRGYRILGTNVRAGRNELDLIVRRGRNAHFRRGEATRGTGFGGAVGAVDAEKRRRVRRAAAGVARPQSAAGAVRIGFEVVAVGGGRLRARADLAERRSELSSPARSRPSPARRIRSRGRDPGGAVRRASTSSSRGPSASCPSASGRSTSTGCTRTSASSSRSSSRRCSTRHVPRGGRVLDPFAGSGTTLVQALESGYDATGVDIAGVQRLLMRVKTRPYNLDALRARPALGARRGRGVRAARPLPAARRRLRARLVRAAAPPRSCSHFRSLVDQVGPADVLRVVLARAARSARRTTHFDLDFPREPQLEPYWCHKHRRECRPVEAARRFLLPLHARHARPDRGVRERPRARRLGQVLHGDARELDLGGPYDGVITSPPYPGLIDYHEQHRYAYELLGLDERRDARARRRRARGTSRAAIAEYVDGIVGCARATRATSLAAGGRVCIVVNDRRDLYPEILERAGLRLVRPSTSGMSTAARAGAQASTTSRSSSPPRAEHTRSCLARRHR